MFDRFTVRVIVFHKSDIYSALDQMIQTSHMMDLDPGNAAVMSMNYPKAGRVSITAHNNPSPTKVKHLEPLMFHLTCMFSSQEELKELLEATKNVVEFSLKQHGFAAGAAGDVPGNGAPYGIWELTDIEVGPPLSFLFR